MGIESSEFMRDECGVFGVYGHPEAANLTYLGLYALQHRGQEGAGIVTGDDGNLVAHRGVGLVADVFKPHRMARLNGNMGIGHVRYSTQGAGNLTNVQPLVVNYARGSMALAHNGNIVNASLLREMLEERGSIFQSTTDTEVIVHFVASSNQERFVSCVIDALQQVVGAYSLLATNGHEVVAARDPLGFRPLWIGRLGEAYIFASESCALDIIDAEWVREVEPGEIVVASEKGLESFHPFQKQTPRPCIFEHVYVARPDSVIFGQSVDEVRKRMGSVLAQEAPADADVVMAVPDSSNQAALGYAHESGIRFDMGFIRNHYVGRTFIEPDQKIRDFGVKIKLNPSQSAIKGQRIVLIDDSIVRGTTSRKIVKMLRRCGVKEIHFRISSPPVINSCFYGIDTPEQDQLLAANMTIPQMQEYLEVDSLAFLSPEGLMNAVGGPYEQHCMACFTNEYPTPVPRDFVTNNHKSIRRHVDISTELFT